MHYKRGLPLDITKTNKEYNILFQFLSKLITQKNKECFTIFVPQTGKIQTNSNIIIIYNIINLPNVI